MFVAASRWGRQDEFALLFDTKIDDKVIGRAPTEKPHNVGLFCWCFSVGSFFIGFFIGYLRKR